MTGGLEHRTVVLVSGRGSNLRAIINRSEAGELKTEIAAVISDRPATPAIELAIGAGIPALTLDYAAFSERSEFDVAIERLLAGLNPELVVLAGFMRILPTGLVEAFHGRMLNVHPSLLPKYPGLRTYRRALESGDEWHGSTVHFVTPQLDAGPSIIQYRVRVQPDDDEASLRERVVRGEHLIYPRSIAWAAEGRLQLVENEPWLDGRRLTAPLVETER
jgi:phosphoribosylglycinamide formyltransferase-1